MSIIFFVLFVEASAVIVCKFQPNRSTFEYEFEYEYECVANFMDIRQSLSCSPNVNFGITLKLVKPPHITLF